MKIFSRTNAQRIITTMLLIAVSGACQDELADRYLNPDRTTAPSIDEFFVRMLDNNRVRPSYWEISTFVNWHIGVYTQAVGVLNSASVYQQNERYIADRWDDYYRPGANGAGVMAHFREIENAYAELTGEEQRNMEVFVQAAKVVLCEQTAQMVDLWGDIPFSEAGMLNKTGEVVYPPFDDAREVYGTLLERMAEAALFFRSAALSSTTQDLFSRQDILLRGDLKKWERYANALRLRLLMRISFVEEDQAREEVMAMLSAPDAYPLVGDPLPYAPAEDDVLLHPLTDYADDLHAAFTDWTNYPAPYFMLEEVLKPASDLRIPVLFDKYGVMDNGQFTPNTEYQGMPLAFSRLEQQANLGNYSILDSTTFLYNAQLPGVLMTAAEVSFLKAEAYERWGGGDPEETYRTAIIQSVDFYYYLNSINENSLKKPRWPSEAEKNEFSSVLLAQYTGTAEEKLARIWTQKWVHFGFLQAVQSWSEIRRTKYPALTFVPASLSGYELPPSRLTYPGNERTLNSHYAAVAGKDTRDGKIFWDVR